jgi:CheY-like chemotaxis protein
MFDPDDLRKRQQDLEQLLVEAQTQRENLLRLLSNSEDKIDSIQRSLSNCRRQQLTVVGGSPKIDFNEIVLSRNGNSNGHHDRLPESWRALVVDDSRVVARITASHLRSLGASVDIAYNGSEGLAMMASKVYDIVLMDIAMPVLNGLETIKAQRKAELIAGKPRTPVVAVTATAERKQCIDAGFDDHVTKPLQPDDLKQILAKHLRSAQK